MRYLVAAWRLLLEPQPPMRKCGRGESVETRSRPAAVTGFEHAPSAEKRQCAAERDHAGHRRERSAYADHASNVRRGNENADCQTHRSGQRETECCRAQRHAARSKRVGSERHERTDDQRRVHGEKCL